MIKFNRHYPRVIFTSESSYDIDSLRSELSMCGIYITVVPLTEAAAAVDSAEIMFIYSPEYSSRAKALVESLPKKEMPAVVFAGSADDIDPECNALVIPADNGSICATLCDIFKETFKLDPLHAEDEEIICELTKPTQVYYNGTKISLSKSETKIVHFLLSLEPRTLVSKEVIGEYLSLAPGAVPVHIHNINEKSMQAYHDKLVFSRSSRGYFVY